MKQVLHKLQSQTDKVMQRCFARFGEATTWAFLSVSVIISGYVNVFDFNWSPAFQFNLWLHPILSWVATLLLMRALYLRIKIQMPGLHRAATVTYLIIFTLAFARAFTFEYLPIEQSNKVAGLSAIALFPIGGYFATRMFVLLPKMRKEPASWWMLFVGTSWTLCAASGLLLFLLLGGRKSFVLFEAHAMLAYAATAAAFGMALFRFGRTHLGQLAKGAIIAMTLVAVSAVLIHGTNSHNIDSTIIKGTTIKLAVSPLAERPAEQLSVLPLKTDAKYFDIGPSCGSGNCHDDILADHNRSLHALAFQTEHIQKVIDLLRQDVGEEDVVMCKGCHIPSSLMQNGLSIDDFRSRDNIGCVFCHVVQEVRIDGGRYSEIDVAISPDHLEPFVEAEQQQQPLSLAARTAINLNPKAHGKIFSRPLLNQDEFCLACHRGRVAILGSGPSCVACHMPPRKRLGEDGKSKSHIFIGANTSTYELLHYGDHVNLVNDWVSSDRLTRELAAMYQPDEAGQIEFGQARLDQFQYVSLSSAITSPIQRGEPIALEIRSANVGMTHAFPSASLDFLEAWLEVRVYDEHGRTVFEQPALQADGSLYADAITLGGRLVDAEGKSIDRYRVWRAKGSEIHRRLMPYQSQTDTIHFDLPADAGERLNVEARWRYRKLGHAFWVWSYGNDTPPPTSTVAEHRAQYRVAP